MNEAGRHALRAAGLAGVPQMVGRLRGDGPERCGVGVLFEAIGLLASHVSTADGRWDALMDAYDLRRPIDQCPLCDDHGFVDEASLLIHANDVHECDFFKLADLLPVTDAEPS